MRSGDLGIVSLTDHPEEGNTYITIGWIVSAVGLRGEVKCALMTDFPKRFFSLEAVVVETKEGRRYPLQIERVRHRAHFVYLIFKGISSREQAEPLKNGRIQIKEEDRTPLPPDHYYQYEIEGLSVYLEEGTCLGKVASVLTTGGNDVYIVKQNRREYLIPAIKSVVKKIDLVKREMTICPMEGLLDL